MSFLFTKSQCKSKTNESRKEKLQISLPSPQREEHIVIIVHKQGANVLVRLIISAGDPLFYGFTLAINAICLIILKIQGEYTRGYSPVGSVRQLSFFIRLETLPDQHGHFGVFGIPLPTDDEPHEAGSVPQHASGVGLRHAD